MGKLYKWLAVVAALVGALGYSAGDKTEWLKFGTQALEKVGGSALPELKKMLPDVLAAAVDSEDTSAVGSTSDSSKNRKNYTGRVTKVSDGDTIHVTDSNGRKHKIRMANIDAPELHQAYGTRSRDALQAAADGEKVTVRVYELDRYQREVAQVWQGDTDLNLQQIRQGVAWHYAAYAKKQQDKADYNAYAAAQEKAKQQRKGLWRNRNPQAPWDYRREQRNQGSGAQSQEKKWFGIW
ncbi:endonuclease YncB(thermonuclease family) [Neisseria perflava]|uniref:thermonuclease family protein n=1 Tax=Neisseria perflava TaxID=33053 RepID=UPI0020A13662|nr:thermonuclease family protein [Neisseria perflava]MCP1771268.1 endonuclease YncB(thermonuclease family) [Neisseria perflava]